ncbi:hypothetical protein Glove_86g227 [Diversispora epigaea]|uniref:Protein kinase domain-containing protein n=1 Tax=Diversispora epigaea TaxID=1348612 RepID=A0A397J781_9GLOM|nr:hypothetical protein Glove_86g227 [Diversispora epigaea]
MSDKKVSFENALKNIYIKKFDYNKFENFERIASGSFGTVYRANSKNLGIHVALKSLHENDNELFYKKFVKELTNILAVNYHDNIIKFYGISIDPSTETYYLVLQYAKDGNLRTYLRNNFNTLDWKIKIQMAKDITNGLDCIHEENIVHGNLHSKNILVHEGRLLITDLGLSQPLDANSNSFKGSMVAYADPEYLRSQMKKKRNKPSDIYSLGVLFWELSSGRPPFNNFTSLEILKKVISGEREKPINGTPKDYINIYSNAWIDDPNRRSTIKNIFDSLENIQLENVYNIPSENIQLKNDENISISKDTVSSASSDQTSSVNSSEWKREGFFIDETPNISQDDASISNSESVRNALGVLGVVGDAVQPYLPLFSIVTTIITEINNIYANAKYNKNICNSLMDRVNAAEFSIKNLERRKNENEKNFRDEGYFIAFHRFIEVMKNTKQFIANVSTLSGFQKYFHAKSVKDKFESLINEFESAMSDLHFTTNLHNEEQKRIDHESLNSDLQEMAKFLNTIGENVIDTDQQVNTTLTEIGILKNQMVSPKSNTAPITANEIDPKDLKDPQVGRPDDRRGTTIVRKILNGENVACKIKIIDAEQGNIKARAHLAILGKLKESKNILKFYGLSKVEDQDVMVFEWADYGSLQEVYLKYDIGWRSKIQTALDICRGLVFLQTCDILHHDIRCANIMMTKQLVPKLSNFKYARHNSQATTDIKEITNILRWMAPEKMKDPKNVRYTFKCEIFSFGMLLWELLFQKIPYENKDMNQIKDHVLKGCRETIIMNFSSQENRKIQNKFFKIIISAWQQDINIRASLFDIFLKLQKLAANYPIDTSPTLNPLGSLYLSQMKEPIPIEKSVDELPDPNQRQNIDRVELTESNTKESAINHDTTKFELNIVVVEASIIPFVPLFRAINLVISEFTAVYENIQYNKKIYKSLMDRVLFAKAVVNTLKKRQTEHVKYFRNQEYYKSFIHFIEIIKRIKKFVVDVSSLDGYQEPIHSGSDKDSFDSLVKDFDAVITELHFNDE